MTLALSLVACSDDENDNKPKDTGPTTDLPSKIDSAPPVTALDCTGHTCQDYVMDNLLMPTTTKDAEKYALIVNGQKKNALGSILALIASQAKTMDIQKSITDAINKGSTLLLLRVQADDLTTESSAKGQSWVGAAKTCCTTTDDSTKCAAEAKSACFNGSATFYPSSSSPPDIRFSGGITSGKMDLRASKMKLLIPLTSQGSLSLTLKAVNLTGKISSSVITDGILAGAIPKADLDSSVIPEVAKMLNSTYTDPKTDKATVDILKQLFDLDSDGKITETEVKDNPLIKTFLKGDVDVDSDGEKELSLGIGFSSVSAKIDDTGTPPDGGPTPDLPTTTPDITITPDASIGN